MIYRFTRWLEETTDELKYKFQRLTRGYSDDEVWNLNYAMCKWMLPRLKKLSETRHGYWGRNEKETKQAYKDMIFALEFFLSEDGMDWAKPSKNYEKKYARHLKGLELIGKHWQSLWD